MADKPIKFGPVELTTTYTTNLLNPADAGAGAVGYTPSASKILLTHITIINKTATDRSYRLFIGATGANADGTEFMGYDKVVAANDREEWFGAVPLATTDFLVGGASANDALVIQGEGLASLE